MEGNKRKHVGEDASNNRKRRTRRVQEEEEETAASPFASLDGKRYDIILADPPWSYDSRGVAGAAAKQYPTMTDAEIAALPLPDISERGAFVLMWATAPKLPQAFDVMKAWGFEFKTMFLVWMKTAKNGEPVRNGIGFYTRSACEYMLLGRRKDAKVPLKDVRASQSVSQMILAPRREHSRKPDETFERISAFFKPELTRVELFSRESRPGWDCWGLETGKFDEE
jgi:N6-adenosine-specific RNA methylase IME4